MKKFFVLVLALVMALSLTTVAFGAATEVATADALVNATKAGTAEIKLTADITLPAGQHIPVVADLVVDGNGHSITFTPGTGLFNNLNGVAGPGPEGITNNLTVKNLTMISTTGGGHAVVAKNGAADFAISFTNCHFEDMYCGVMLNGNVDPTPGATNAPNATVSSSTFEDTEYGVSFVTADCVDEVSFENNTMTGETSIQETFAAGSGYLTTPTVEISSGSFSSDVSDYLTDGYAIVGNTVTVMVPDAKATTYEGLYAQDANTLVKVPNVDIVVVPAKAVKYDKVTGVPTAGQIEYVNVFDGTTGWPASYKFVNTLDQADVVLYKDAAYKQVRFYLAKVDGVSYFEGVAFTNFGEDCGETTYDADKTLKYFTIKGATAFEVYEEVKAPATPATFVMYNGEMVGVKFATSHKVAHTAVYTTKNGVVQSIECGACGLDAVKVANVLSLPKGADVVANETVWYWPAAVVAPSTDKTVESAATFDAGIAMYVGMSVLAATGSAVVLKKRER